MTPRILALVLAALVSAAALAQRTEPAEPRPETAATKAGDAALPPAAKAWPPIAAVDRDRAISLTGQFKKDDEALHAEARKQLLALGVGAAPILFQKIGDADRELALNEALFPVLDEMLHAEHRQLMADQAKADQAKKRKLELRNYLVLRLCQFGDPELKDGLAYFAKDTDERIAFHAHLGLAALGEPESVIAVLESTRTQWADHKPMVEKVLPHARSAAVGAIVVDYIGKKPPPVQAAGLRLLRYVATEEHKATVKSFLSSEDHNLKREAVNALRVMSGQEALENLSAFEAIGMAKEWMTK